MFRSTEISLLWTLACPVQFRWCDVNVPLESPQCIRSVSVKYRSGTVSQSHAVCVCVCDREGGVCIEYRSQWGVHTAVWPVTTDSSWLLMTLQTLRLASRPPLTSTCCELASSSARQVTAPPAWAGDNHWLLLLPFFFFLSPRLNDGSISSASTFWHLHMQHSISDINTCTSTSEQTVNTKTRLPMVIRKQAASSTLVARTHHLKLQLDVSRTFAQLHCKLPTGYNGALHIHP